jgi:hypothetical protein
MRLIAWGDRCPVAEINRLIAAVRAQSPTVARFVLLSDRPRPGLDPGCEVRPIPDWYLQPQMMRGPETIAILQSAILPFGAAARRLFRVTGGRRYARGNSSVVVFHPAQCGYVAMRYRALHAAHGFDGLRPMVADERFLSWAAQPVVRAVPGHLAVKFPTEYMQPWRWLVHLRASLPWIRRRRAGLVAVTFPGVKFKGEDLAALPEGATVTDRKGRRLFWTDRALGPLRARIIQRYRTGASTAP